MRLLVLTNRAQAQRSLVDVVNAAVEGGARHILLREKDLPRQRRAELASAIQQFLIDLAPTGGVEPGGSDGGRLVVASDLGLAREVGATGVHLAADDPWPVVDDLVVGDRKLLVGRSCHSAPELLEARERGVDYVTLSPVFATVSKPGYGPALGLDRLARLCAEVSELPVLALGGIEPGRVARCLDAGATGVAVMGAVMAADDPADVVTRLRDELAAALVGGAPDA